MSCVTVGWAPQTGQFGSLLQLELAEAHGERVDKKHAPNERLALAQNELDDLSGLDDADQAGKNAQHAALGTIGHQARRGRLGIEAAVAGPLARGKDAGLALKPENRPVDVGLAREDAGIVDQVARGEVVSAVGYDVIVLEDFEGVLAPEHGFVLDHVERGIEGEEFFLGGVELTAANVPGGVDDLPLQVACVDHVEIHQPKRPDAGRGKIQRKRRAETASSHAEDASGLQPLLALHAYLGQDEVARVAGEIGGSELG